MQRESVMGGPTHEGVAWSMGYEAAINGLALSDNPMMTASECEAWDSGYIAAEAARAAPQENTR